MDTGYPLGYILRVNVSAKIRIFSQMLLCLKRSWCRIAIFGPPLKKETLAKK